MDYSPKHVPKVSHHEDGSVFSSRTDGSLFSEENPLAKGDVVSLAQGTSKKPQAVALHGWQRTVAVDEDFDPTISVCLGAPGTGLIRKPPAKNGIGSAGPLCLAEVDPEALVSAKVTREDKREAKSLRALPVAPGATPLPFPRVASETDASSVAESLDSTVFGSGEQFVLDDTSQRCRERRLESQSSTGSSDLNFLVKTTGTGSFFGTRPTFGRAVEPRIPSTVGEERLHNSLAKYFTQVRKEVQTQVEGSQRESQMNSTASPGKERSGRGTVSSTPLTKPETRQSSLDDFPSNRSAPGVPNPKVVTASSDEGMDDAHIRTKSIPNRTRSYEEGDRRHRKEPGVENGDTCSVPTESKAAGEVARRESNVRFPHATSKEQGNRYAEGGLLDQEDHVGDRSKRAPRRPRERRASKCGCLAGWPWKLLSGLLTLGAVVAIVIVINTGEDVDRRRRLTGMSNGSFVSLGHSRRPLSIAGLVPSEPGKAAAGRGVEATTLEGKALQRTERGFQRRRLRQGEP